MLPQRKRACREVEVIALKSSPGAPCHGHAGMAPCVFP